MTDLIPAPSDDTERALIRAATRGDADAWQELDQRLRPRLRSLLSGRIPIHIRSRFDVDDVVQQTFLEAARRIQTFEDRGDASFSHWLQEILFNELRDKIRFHGAQKRSFEREEEVASRILNLANLDLDTPSTILSEEERARGMSAALASLSPEDRELIRMRFHEHLSWAEIAQRVGSSETTVRRRGHDALEPLLRDLD